jgi:UDP-N-acetylmuramyl tripeptide synthase
VTAAEDHRAGPLGAFVPATSNAAQSVASAAALTLPQGVRVVTVTGTTGITSIVATGHSGHVVTLIFAGILTVTDGSNLKLASSYTTTADDTLTLACDGVSWYEVARSVN